jgi:STE24 endopeptidase
MKTGQFLLGLAGGAAFGYAAFRAYEALELRHTWQSNASSDAAEYGRTRRRLGVSALLRSIAGTVAFAYGPAPMRIERLTHGLPSWARPAAFLGMISIASAAIDLPVALSEDYAIERRFGLSEQTMTAFLADYAKSVAVSAPIVATLGGLAAFALRRAPRTWPLYCALGVFPFLVLGNLIAPLYIMPLFNRFEPLRGPLEERLRALASRFGVGDAEILRMDMSRQTKKANAFVTGLGSTHRIVLGDTLVDQFTIGEVEFVVAHELGHYVTKDTWRLIGIVQALATLALAAAAAALREDDGADGVRVLRAFAVMTLVFQATRPLFLQFSRSREWAADRFAIDATRDPRAGADAFVRLRDQNLAEDDVPGWYEFFFSSHPSLGQRISALRAAE